MSILTLKNRIEASSAEVQMKDAVVNVSGEGKFDSASSTNLGNDIHFVKVLSCSLSPSCSKVPLAFDPDSVSLARFCYLIVSLWRSDQSSSSVLQFLLQSFKAQVISVDPSLLAQSGLNLKPLGDVLEEIAFRCTEASQVSKISKNLLSLLFPVLKGTPALRRSYFLHLLEKALLTHENVIFNLVSDDSWLNTVHFVDPNDSSDTEDFFHFIEKLHELAHSAGVTPLSRKALYRFLSWSFLQCCNFSNVFVLDLSALWIKLASQVLKTSKLEDLTSFDVSCQAISLQILPTAVCCLDHLAGVVPISTDHLLAIEEVFESLNRSWVHSDAILKNDRHLLKAIAQEKSVEYIVETPHPYPPGFRFLKETISFPDADAVVVTFDPLCATKGSMDSIYLYQDPGMNDPMPIGPFFGNEDHSGSCWPSGPTVIWSNSVTIAFTGRSPLEGTNKLCWGFRCFFRGVKIPKIEWPIDIVNSFAQTLSSQILLLCNYPCVTVDEKSQLPEYLTDLLAMGLEEIVENTEDFQFSSRKSIDVFIKDFLDDHMPQWVSNAYNEHNVRFFGKNIIDRLEPDLKLCKLNFDSDWLISA